MKEAVLYPLRRLHGFLHDLPDNYNERKKITKEIIIPIKQFLKEYPSAVFLVLTPEHGNLGDHAIAFAETRLLKNANIPYFEITGNKLNMLKKHKLLRIMNGHTVLINGGGNMGTLWFDVEQIHRAIIKENSRSPIFIMPNTIYYENSPLGESELKKSIAIYNKHNKLTIFAREKTSFDIMKSIYKNVHLMPDMVMYLKLHIQDKKRSGCLLCLRNDCEKTITKEQEQEIRNQAKILFNIGVCDTDTIVPGGVTVDDREAALKAKLSEFSSAELVITDRLHGMLFCAITGTPCIVINSKSPKVRGCYEWIEHLDYICLVDDVKQISSSYKNILNVECKYDNAELLFYYEELLNILEG